MRDAAREQRKAQIEAAAYAVLAEKGFQNMSMLAVAKAAKASNETLYRWYGDKTGLFQALIKANADVAAERLQAQLDGSIDPKTALSDLGPLLLDMLLGDRAIALNRVAASDASGTLGQVLAQAGRGRVFPLIVQVFQRLVDAKILVGAPPELARLYIDLLVGDLQIRRATGALGPLSVTERQERAKLAEARMFTLASQG
jgi:AcrR family transcriptional regulator